MHNSKIRYLRFTNIIIAILCAFIVFLGFQVAIKLTKLNKPYTEDMSQIKDEAVFAFTNIEKNEEIKTDSITLELDEMNKNKWFLNIIVKSNAYMECFINMHSSEEDDNQITFFDSFLSMINIEDYFKTHLPAIFNIVDSTFAFGDESDEYKKIENTKDKESPMILEDLIFIEDPEESEEGERLENNINEESTIVSGLPEPKDIELIKANTEDPYVLIYHTHGTEAFLPIKENQFHTTERKYNVISIGDIISEELIKAGHKVEHVDIYHDIPSYNESYYRSITTAKDVIAKNSNIKFIFDIHRDGVDEDASYIEKAKKEAKININGEEVATFSMVIGNDNPNKEELINFAKYIKLITDRMYPGLCKGIIIKPYGKFNQYLSNHYVLLEVGSNLNTIDEAKRSAQLIADVINNVINQILIK